MADFTTTKLNPELHLILDQPLLRLPYELSRKNFKTAQNHIEKEKEKVLASLKTTTQTAAARRQSSGANGDAASDPSIESLDAIISRMQGLKRKLEALHEEEMKIHRSSKARVQHLQDLYEIQSLVDVKYDDWSRIRLSRLLVDYLLRSGYTASAAALAAEKSVTDLVDVDAFVACHRIEHSLREGHRPTEALNWCIENRQAGLMKKGGRTLEFELRLQQYIEMVRAGKARDGGMEDMKKAMDAVAHAKKFLTKEEDMELVQRAAGLLAFDPQTEVEPYKSLYSSSRWGFLADLFLKTHNELFSLPSRPLLHIALSAGLSALKTPACHSQYASSSSNASSSTTTVCPICSTELNELARNVPYAHHAKSHVENDPVVLPNGRIYGRERLCALNEKLGTEKGLVRDPTDINQSFHESQIKKVFFS